LENYAVSFAQFNLRHPVPPTTRRQNLEVRQRNRYHR